MRRGLRLTVDLDAQVRLLRLEGLLPEDFTKHVDSLLESEDNDITNLEQALTLMRTWEQAWAEDLREMGKREQRLGLLNEQHLAIARQLIRHGEYTPVERPAPSAEESWIRPPSRVPVYYMEDRERAVAYYFTEEGGKLKLWNIIPLS